MILILSQSNLEESTNDIIDWLESLKANYFRFNGEDLISEEILFSPDTGNSLYIKINQSEIDTDNVNVVWNRRWIHKDYFTLYSYFPEEINLMVQLNKHLRYEFMSLSRSFYESFKGFWINDFRYQKLNKFNVLKLAKSKGITIPDTIITNRKDKLIAFNKKHKKLISKCIHEISGFKTKEFQVSHYTNVVDKETIEKTEDTFFPSLFQEMVDKEFEIRTFYYDEKFYSMAIFSQRNEKTSIDFRHYDTETPNRNVPYKLPEEIKDKLRSLMKDLSLFTGSIDLIYDKSGRYVFLEINPQGQFGMVSAPCNYFLEKKIARHLYELDKSY